MTLSTIARKRTVQTEPPRAAAVWLTLAASPTFALMACISGNDIEAMMGSSAHGVLPLGGMAWMYVLMSLFHVSPWLKVLSCLTRPSIQSTPQARGD